MKRICSIFAMLTIIALFNIGGCGGSDSETNNFSPVIDRVVFYQNTEKIKQTQSYTQGSEGVVEISISDYDLNAETVDVRINQCANKSCQTLTGYHTPGIYNLSQTNASFSYTFQDMTDTIKILPATHYYQFVFEVMDRDGQSSVVNKIIQIHTGIPPEIYDLYFYKERYPGERLDTWNSYYDFVAEFKARDLDLNAKYIYIIRTCLKTTDANQEKPVFNELGPIELDAEDTKTTEMTIDAETYVNQKTSETSMVQKMVMIEGLYEITIRLEDTLGNTSEISKSITVTH
jgi:hypothetical protein